MAKEKYEVVFTGTDSWFQARADDFQIDDNFEEEAFDWAEENLGITDNDESFACTVLSSGENTAIHAGDVVVSNGCGDDKIFLRRVS